MCMVSWHLVLPSKCKEQGLKNDRNSPVTAIPRGPNMEHMIIELMRYVNQPELQSRHRNPYSVHGTSQESWSYVLSR